MTEFLSINGFRLKSPVMNGAGPVKLPQHVLEIAKSKSGAIVLGSITLKERGNTGKTYYKDSKDLYSLNSKGLPNPGLSYYKKHLPEMVKIAHNYDKPLIVSIAGFSPSEYAKLAKEVFNLGADGTEINLGCPNVWGKTGKQKRIASFDLNLIKEILVKVGGVVGAGKWVAMKVSPYSDPLLLNGVALLFNKSKVVKAVVTTNSFPNAFSFGKKGVSVIDPGEGFSGMGGKALKPIGLGQVKQFRKFLSPRINVIGAGGVTTDKDVDDYLKAGAIAVQKTTAYINFGPRVLSYAGK